ncbi:MAG: tryptophan 2,3-dioxygenase family protein [Proteobacteria bacterium]|nr:tryptophan 2,3-dioxygenase family protein [Pseudomonadota bacterium]
MNVDDNFRKLEKDIKLDVDLKDNYGGYLRIDQILSAQIPLSNPPHHDEMLFIIQHQVSELWLKLIVHELKAAILHIKQEKLDIASKILARVKQIQKQLFEQWGVLETLTPSEYIQFRHVFGSASGFQSVQYRMVEFLLGNKNVDMLKMFPKESASYVDLFSVLDSPSIYDVFLQHLFKMGYGIPDVCVERNWQDPHQFNDDLVQVFVEIYKNTDKNWDAYALCEQLVDVEQSFQMWRFRHMKTVERIIGFKKGSGGSSGVSFLNKALELTFFPELLDVRTHL